MLDKAIENYFSEYSYTYDKAKRALKNYLDAKEDFYNLTGTKYDDMPKAQSKKLGLDDLLIHIEELHTTWLMLDKKCKEEKAKCLIDIDKLENKIYRLLIEYAYLNFESDKKILKSLKEIHNLDYSYSYIRKIKSKAKKEFKQIIIKNN